MSFESPILRSKTLSSSFHHGSFYKKSEEKQDDFLDSLEYTSQDIIISVKRYSLMHDPKSSFVSENRRQTVSSAWTKIKSFVGAKKSVNKSLYSGYMMELDYQRIFNQWNKLCVKFEVPFTKPERIKKEFQKRIKNASTENAKSKLDLSHCHLTDTQIQALCKTLAINPKISHLNISYNRNITIDGYESIKYLLSCQKDIADRFSNDLRMIHVVFLHELVDLSDSQVNENIQEIKEDIQQICKELSLANAKVQIRRLYIARGSPDIIDIKFISKIWKEIVGKNEDQIIPYLGEELEKAYPDFHKKVEDEIQLKKNEQEIEEELNLHERFPITYEIMEIIIFRGLNSTQYLNEKKTTKPETPRKNLGFSMDSVYVQSDDIDGLQELKSLLLSSKSMSNFDLNNFGSRRSLSFIQTPIRETSENSLDNSHSDDNLEGEIEQFGLNSDLTTEDLLNRTKKQLFPLVQEENRNTLLELINDLIISIEIKNEKEKLEVKNKNIQNEIALIIDELIELLVEKTEFEGSKESLLNSNISTEIPEKFIIETSNDNLKSNLEIEVDENNLENHNEKNEPISDSNNENIEDIKKDFFDEDDLSDIEKSVLYSEDEQIKAEFMTQVPKRSTSSINFEVLEKLLTEMKQSKKFLESVECQTPIKNSNANSIISSPIDQYMIHDSEEMNELIDTSTLDISSHAKDEYQEDNSVALENDKIDVLFSEPLDDPSKVDFVPSDILFNENEITSDIETQNHDNEEEPFPYDNIETLVSYDVYESIEEDKLPDNLQLLTLHQLSNDNFPHSPTTENNISTSNHDLPVVDNLYSEVESDLSNEQEEHVHPFYQNDFNELAINLDEFSCSFIGENKMKIDDESITSPQGDTISNIGSNNKMDQNNDIFDFSVSDIDNDDSQSDDQNILLNVFKHQDSNYLDKPPKSYQDEKKSVSKNYKLMDRRKYDDLLAYFLNSSKEWEVIEPAIDSTVNNFKEAIHNIEESIRYSNHCLAELDPNYNPDSDPYLRMERERMLQEESFSYRFIDRNKPALGDDKNNLFEVTRQTLIASLFTDIRNLPDYRPSLDDNYKRKFVNYQMNLGRYNLKEDEFNFSDLLKLQSCISKPSSPKFSNEIKENSPINSECKVLFESSDHSRINESNLLLVSNELWKVSNLAVTRLVLCYNRIENISNLHLILIFPRLIEIDLSNNKIKHLTNDLSMEIFPKNLQRLNLSNNQLFSIKGLNQLTKLQKLDISHNRIRSIDPLSNNLIELNIGYNYIDNVLSFRVLSRVYSLLSLDITGNPLVINNPKILKDIQKIKILIKSSKCKITYKRLTNNILPHQNTSNPKDPYIYDENHIRILFPSYSESKLGTSLSIPKDLSILTSHGFQEPSFQNETISSIAYKKAQTEAVQKFFDQKDLDRKSSMEYKDQEFRNKIASRRSPSPSRIVSSQKSFFPPEAPILAKKINWINQTEYSIELCKGLLIYLWKLSKHYRFVHQIPSEVQNQIVEQLVLIKFLDGNPENWSFSPLIKPEFLSSKDHDAMKLWEELHDFYDFFLQFYNILKIALAFHENFAISNNSMSLPPLAPSSPKKPLKLSIVLGNLIKSPNSPGLRLRNRYSIP